MADPFSFLPLALAGRDGRVDDFDAGRLVAAGIALLQRSAPLVRALSGRRSAILLPASPHFLVALAASEGRGAVLIDPAASRYEIAHRIADGNVGAVFTNAALAASLPEETARAILDEAPRTARVIVAGRSRDVDLGSHHGLTVEGDPDAEGSDNDAVVIYSAAAGGQPTGCGLSHRALLADARALVAAGAATSDDRVLALLPFSRRAGLTVACVAPLLAGGRILTMPRFDAARAAELIGSGRVTVVVGVPEVFPPLLAALESTTGDRTGGALRLAFSDGGLLTADLQERWLETTGIGSIRVL